MEDGDTLQVRAVIRQSLLITQIDMHGETTKSLTLETTPNSRKWSKETILRLSFNTQKSRMVTIQWFDLIRCTSYGKCT